MFYGRKYEINIIKKAINSPNAELGIVYGRRRIGKSELLKQAGKRCNTLYFEGLQNANTLTQINHFINQFSQQANLPKYQAANWHEAFNALSLYLKKGKHYIVFDEFPWMACGRTELVSLLKYYWDNHWKTNSGLTLVLCGSVASFMFNHIVHSQALHNRKTFEIKLGPLPASEAKLFFKNYRSNFEIARFLMIFGGVPKYLEQLNPVHSLEGNLDSLCFMKNSFFLNEFNTVFNEQFKVTKHYETIAGQLAEKSCFREELAGKLNMKSGGGLTSYLTNLENADFIKVMSPVNAIGKGNKTRKLVLWDEWLQFYFSYIRPHINVINLNTEPGLFSKLCLKSFDTYCGLMFEKMCMKNLPVLLQHMGIPLNQLIGYSPYFRQASRSRKNTGLQIDILIHRSGHILSVVECKFSSLVTGPSVIEEVERKVKLLNAPKHYTVEKILICGGDISNSVIKSGYFHQILGLEALFD